MSHGPDPATIRCAVCGVPWPEHDVTTICERYRPKTAAKPRVPALEEPQVFSLTLE